MAINAIETSPPRSYRVSPDRNINADQGAEFTFTVSGYKGSHSISHVTWLKNDVVVDTSDAFESREIERGYGKESMNMTFIAGENQTVEAVVYDEQGKGSSQKWYLDIASTFKPVVTPITPIASSDEPLVVPLGVQQKFSVNVFDQDDDTRHLFWHMNGVQIQDDTVGGGNPMSNETHKIIFTEAGDYVVSAIASDKKGQQHFYSWDVHAGTSTAGNDAPICEIFDSSDLGEEPIFHVGYRYDMKFRGYDVDGNLAYAEGWLNGTHELRPGCAELDWCYTDDRVNGDVDNVSFTDVIFTSVGSNTLSMLIRDQDGAENTCSLTVDVAAADEGSSSTPEILTMSPASGSTFYLPLNQKFEVDLLLGDDDGDLETLQVFVNGSLFDDYSLDDSTDLYNGGISFPSNGTYSVTYKVIDSAGNATVSPAYTVYAGNSAGSRSHMPILVDAKPNIANEYIASTSADGTRKFCPYLDVFDPDGDLKYIFWQSTAGPLDDIDGQRDGYNYDRESISSTGATKHRKRGECFDITQNGNVWAYVQDAKGNEIHLDWDVTLNQVSGNNSPSITFSSIEQDKKI